MEYSRVTRKLVCRGIQLAKPVDEIDAGKFSILLNARSYTDGAIECRPGVALLGAMAALDQTYVHSIRRLNDPLPTASQPFTRIVGAGTKLYSGVAPGPGSIATGFSGNPLSMVQHRPPESPESMMYIGDSNKMVKVTVAGAVQNVGGAPPLGPPDTALAVAVYNTLSDFEAVGGWVNGGTAGGLAASARVNTTIVANGILFDVGITGWACIAPTAIDQNTQPGMFLTINAGGGTAETVLVDSIQRTSVLAASTIGSIIYDVGNTGLCTIQLSIPNPLIVRNSMLRITGGVAENIRVLSMTPGPDGLSSFRCVTVNNHAAGEAITGFVSFRAYCVNTHAAAETLTTNQVTSAIAAGIGYLTLAGALNLSAIGSRPVQIDDILHLSIKMDSPQNLTEGRMLLDFDIAGGGAGSVFTQNYFYGAFRQDDLTSAAIQTQTVVNARQVQIQRGLIDQTTVDPRQAQIRDLILKGVPDIAEGVLTTATDLFLQGRVNDGFKAIEAAGHRIGAIFPQYKFQINMLANQPASQVPVLAPAAPPTPQAEPDAGTGQTVSLQATTGASQWTEVSIRIGDLTRVGSDYTRGLANIGAIRISFNVNAATNIAVDAWYERGSYGPTVEGVGSPLIYRYRGRSSTTGVKTNPGPPMRYGEIPFRGRVVVSPTQHPDAQFDKLDIERFGGANLGWHTVGTCANSATPTFNDDYSDIEIQNAPPLDLDNYQPFPMFDSPKSGTCDVAGTAVKALTGVFNTAWARGTIINVNGKDYTLYTNPSSTTILHVNENIGALTNVAWFILQPILLGQPLPSLWGPHPTLDIVFGCGSLYQPGHLFWTKFNETDAAPITYQQEVTDPSEPLVNGLILPDGRAFVWSTERYFIIYPSMKDLTSMSIIEAGKRGLFASWAMAAGEGDIWWLDKDGIYQSSGGGRGVSITDDDLYPLFPHDGVAGAAVNGFSPPDMTVTAKLRLSYENGFVIFDYVDTLAAQRRMVYRVRDKAWFPDLYAAPILTMSYREEGQGLNSVLCGATDGKIYQVGGTADAGVAIPWQVRTNADDFGDSRPQKAMGDIAIDLNTAGVDVVITPLLNNFVTALATTTINNAARPGADLPLIEFDEDQLARNLGLNFAIASYGPKLYQWLPTFVPKPENTGKRATDWTDDRYTGAKFVQGLVIEADTGGVNRTVEVQYDGGVVAATLTINHDGQIEVAYPNSSSGAIVPFIAHSMRLVPTDANSWRLFQVRWIWEPAPELSTNWQTQGTTHDLPGYKTLDQTAFIALISTDEITLTINADGTNYSFTVPSTAGLQKKLPVSLSAFKGLLLAYNLGYPGAVGNGFRLFKLDSEIGVKRWGSGGQFEMMRPFGGPSRVSGAEI